MSNRRVVLTLLAGLPLAACAQSKFIAYDGPEVTRVQINKGDRKMYLFAGTAVLRQYDIGLGFAPVGPKRFENDGRTPEGQYYVDRRNPNSRFHLSLGINYPNEADRAYALAAGKAPGNDIFIHGGPQLPADRARARGNRDWTWGCIAVTDREIEQVYAMVRDGTPVLILA